MLVPKPDGMTCFCTDFLKVNVVSKFNAQPMPTVDELLQWLRTARYISTLELMKGYWKITLMPETGGKTAFSASFGLYQ